MELSEIYVGLPVKVIGKDGVYEIETIDCYCNSVWVNKISSIEHDLREVQITNLQRI